MDRTRLRPEPRGRVRGVGCRRAGVSSVDVRVGSGAARLPHIDPRRCTGCGCCVAVCGPHLLSLEVERWVKSAVLHAAERCTGCSACAVACPFHAIGMRRPEAAC